MLGIFVPSSPFAAHLSAVLPLKARFNGSSALSLLILNSPLPPSLLPPFSSQLICQSSRTELPPPLLPRNPNKKETLFFLLFLSPTSLLAPLELEPLPRGRELPQLPPHHVLGDRHLVVHDPVVDLEAQAHEVGQDGGGPGFGAHGARAALLAGGRQGEGDDVGAWGLGLV